MVHVSLLDEAKRKSFSDLFHSVEEALLPTTGWLSIVSVVYAEVRKKGKDGDATTKQGNDANLWFYSMS